MRDLVCVIACVTYKLLCWCACGVVNGCGAVTKDIHHWAVANISCRLHTHTHTHSQHTHAHTRVQISVDFFQFFMASAKVLEADTTVFCVSAWNDHGQEHHVLDPAALYRSDFFPGLGWMTHKVRNTGEVGCFSQPTRSFLSQAL